MKTCTAMFNRSHLMVCSCQVWLCYCFISHIAMIFQRDAGHQQPTSQANTETLACDVLVVTELSQGQAGASWLIWGYMFFISAFPQLLSPFQVFGLTIQWARPTLWSYPSSWDCYCVFVCSPWIWHEGTYLSCTSRYDVCYLLSLGMQERKQFIRLRK